MKIHIAYILRVALGLALASLLSAADSASPIKAAPTPATGAAAKVSITFAGPGQHVTFFVTVDGEPTPTLQWFKDGAKIEGATGLTYVIPSYAPATHAGVYTVTATNIVGSATSEPETLATATAPTISSVRVEVKVNVSISTP